MAFLARKVPQGQHNEQPSSEFGTLLVTVLDAKDLLSGDTKLYATIRVGDKECKTKPIRKTTTPEWLVPHSFVLGSY